MLSRLVVGLLVVGRVVLLLLLLLLLSPSLPLCSSPCPASLWSQRLLVAFPHCLSNFLRVLPHIDAQLLLSVGVAFPHQLYELVSGPGNVSPLVVPLYVAFVVLGVLFCQLDPPSCGQNTSSPVMVDLSVDPRVQWARFI